MNVTHNMYKLIGGRINEFFTIELMHRLVPILLHSAGADTLLIIKSRVRATVVNSGDLI